MPVNRLIELKRRDPKEFIETASGTHSGVDWEVEVSVQTTKLGYRWQADDPGSAFEESGFENTIDDAILAAVCACNKISVIRELNLHES
jgi:hypothetical protein